MIRLTRDTYQRPDDLIHPADPTDPADVLYTRSYLMTRMVVGIIGVVLPIVFIVGEAFFLRGGVHVRGSISAYYHTSMRDIFVAALCVTGFFLATYMAGRSNQDFWLSFVAGVAVLGVVFFPTSRPHLLRDAPRCGVTPMPDGCSPVQQQLGERLVAGIHFGCAVVFILTLAWLCFVFASREQPGSAMARIPSLCGWIILGAVAWAVVGGFLKATIWELTPLYVGEVAAVWAFGAAWLVKSRDLWSALGHPVQASDTRPPDDRAPAERLRPGGPGGSGGTASRR